MHSILSYEREKHHLKNEKNRENYLPQSFLVGSHDAEIDRPFFTPILEVMLRSYPVSPQVTYILPKSTQMYRCTDICTSVHLC